MIDQIKQELIKEEKAKKIFTENGAIGYATSGKNLLDLNFKVASYRHESDATIIKDFKEAYKDDINLAIKWLFFARDIREGLGERRLFRTILSDLIKDEDIWANDDLTNNFKKLLAYIPEYGRWDDLLVAFNTDNKKAQKYIIEFLKKQIDEDIMATIKKQPISICAKWLPSEGATNKARKKLAGKLARAWGMSSRSYRKIINMLKAYLDVTEVKMSANKWDKINYQGVPSKANLLYRNAFIKHDNTRYLEFIEAVKKGEAKINSSVNFPHDIIHKYTEKLGRRKIALDPAIEILWRALPCYELANTLVVADGSGSMTAAVGGTSVTALDVAMGLAIYCSEKNSDVYKNKYITFSDRPQYVEFKDSDSLLDKIKIAMQHNEVATTNIEAVFDLILKTAINSQLTQEDMVKNILIISDMEFNSAVYVSKDSLFEYIGKKWADAGYKVPKLNFWNVNSRTNAIPIQENESGVALISGFSTNLLKMVMSDNLNPYEILLETLLSDRYKNIILS
jgi:hypothetical protein